MPLLEKIKIKGGMIGVWEMTEHPSEFNYLQLNNDDLARLEHYKYEKRKVEFLAVRALIKELTNSTSQIKYLSNGRPFLEGSNQHISISHSKNLATVILSNTPVGIDIEIEGRDIEKILKKFLSETEINDIIHSNHIERAQLLYWCAKEAIFKLTPLEGIDFKNQISITPFEIQENGSFNAKLILNKTTQSILLNYMFIKRNALVWCQENII